MRERQSKLKRDISMIDDMEMNSLLNQQELCRTYACEHRYTIVGESVDDNVSGMKFSRRGLDELTAAADTGKINAVIVKELKVLSPW